jgi:predicted O-linked N-acetylglucosamine transferase (SPINDLY family)
MKFDIAVDLQGFNHYSRMEIFAHGCASIQVNYLGWPSTVGSQFHDYIIADRHVIPPDHFPFFKEKVVWLPDCYQPNDTKRLVADRRPERSECGLPPEGFVFGCFNNSFKITPELFDVWMRLLGNVPGSVLWLLGPDSAGNLRLEAAKRQIDPDRLVFADRRPNPEHLARHHHIDLFLDTLPYNAHTTASDALWMGVPVLTAMGTTFPGRVGASLLNAVGLADLVAPDLQDYETLALELATDRQRLSSIRARLAETGRTMPLFDVAAHRQNLEKAYVEMLRLLDTGMPPRHISVSPR